MHKSDAAFSYGKIVTLDFSLMTFFHTHSDLTGEHKVGNDLIFLASNESHSQTRQYAICSKLTVETQEQGVKYVQS